MWWKITCSGCVLASLLLTGCTLWPFKTTSQEKMPPQKPTAGELISYLNSNAVKINSLRVDDLDMEARVRLIPFGVNGKLVCQKPRNFRLEAYGPSRSLEADLGSNSNEFWFYLARNNPPALFHCRHDEIGRSALNIPFHPEWIQEALGMVEIPSPENFRVEVPKGGDTIELVERTRSPQGQTVFKVTVFNSRAVAGGEPAVTMRKVVDEKGNLLASARIIEMKQDPGTGAYYPRQVELTGQLPNERTEIHLKLTLDSVTVNGPMEATYVQQKFTLPNLGVQSFDLAHSGNSRYPNNSNDAHPTGIFRGLRK